MTLRELQKQALQLPISDRWQLVQILLESLQQETRLVLNRGSLSRLRSIAKGSEISGDEAIAAADYVAYLTKKYQ